ncbi:MAG: hypothetical protein ACI9T7_003166, partial [Oleiphilaceae bacterium]
TASNHVFRFAWLIAHALNSAASRLYGVTWNVLVMALPPVSFLDYTHGIGLTTCCVYAGYST